MVSASRSHLLSNCSVCLHPRTLLTRPEGTAALWAALKYSAWVAGHTQEGIWLALCYLHSACVNDGCLCYLHAGWSLAVPVNLPRALFYNCMSVVGLLVEEYPVTLTWAQPHSDLSMHADVLGSDLQIVSGLQCSLLFCPGNWILLKTALVTSNQRGWFSGRIVPCHNIAERYRPGFDSRITQI